MKEECTVNINERDLFNLFNKLPRNLRKKHSPEIYKDNTDPYCEDTVSLNFEVLISKIWVSSRVQDKYKKTHFAFNEVLDIVVFSEILEMLETFNFKKNNNILSHDIILKMPLSKYKSYIKQVELLIHYDEILSFFLNKKEFFYNNDLYSMVIDQINEDIHMAIRSEQSYNPFVEDDFKKRESDFGKEGYDSAWGGYR